MPAAPTPLRRAVAWVEPEAAFRALFADAGDVFWLDSGADADRGRSYMGSSELTLVGERVPEVVRGITLGVRHGETNTAADGRETELVSGWVGWVSYEAAVAGLLGARPSGIASPADAAAPCPVAMLRASRILVFDHATRSLELRTASDASADRAWIEETAARFAGLAAGGPLPEHGLAPEGGIAPVGSPAPESGLALEGGRAPEGRPAPEHGPAPESRPVPEGAASALTRQTPARTARWRHSPDAYLELIARCQAAIARGDAYQLCLTNTATVDGVELDDAADLYLRLRRGSPAHHGGFVRAGGTAVLSSSPEQFVRVGSGGDLVTKPIKGTRPRGATDASDRDLAAELAADPKERAENVMIVDLLRNDVSRVAEPGTVRVPELLAVESYRHVHQLVSTVEGRMRPGTTVGDLLDALLPPGSMTGTPKRSAVRILEGLERGPRGVYSGAFGWFDDGGAVDLAVVIRSIVLAGGRAVVGSGGGITSDSVPERELAEVELKAAPLLAALGA